MPQLNTTARKQYTQKSTCIVDTSHSNALSESVPYWDMFNKIVPRLMSQAGMNRLSVGWRIDDLREPGWKRNLKLIITILMMNRTMLNRKKITPMVYLPGKSYGTIVVLSVCVALSSMLSARTLRYDVSNTARCHLELISRCQSRRCNLIMLTVIVNHVHVKSLILCRKVKLRGGS